MESGYKRSKCFWEDIIKYGWDNGFEHIILKTNLSKEDAIKLEQQLISKYKASNPNSVYNCTSGGEIGTLGYRHTKEGKEKISLRAKERDRGTYRKDAKAREKYSKIAKEQKRHVINKPPRKVIDKYGNIYESVREASEVLKVNYHTLWNYLNGKRIDKVGVKFYE